MPSAAEEVASARAAPSGRRAGHCLLARALCPVALGLAAVSSACASFGPGTIARDRYAYSDSISESWKRQTLLNVVKLRYLDPPIFVDVGQIVAGYSLETEISLGGEVASPRDNRLALGASGTYTDRPTVTYTPLTGNDFVRALMTPLQPASVFLMIQAGWPADGVLAASLVSINGLQNQETTLGGVTPPDPEFLRVLELLRGIQRSGAVALRVVEGQPEATLLAFRAARVAPEVLEQIHELRALLGLDPQASEFELVFGGLASHERQIAVLTRSVLHVMSAMASAVEVPEEHVVEGRATPGLAPGHESLVRIRGSAEEPEEASVAVSYRDHWFWIDDRDLRSKRAFAFMLLLFTLADTGGPKALPLVTIPAQ